MIDLYDEFRRVIEVLDEHKVDYALCGGMAMAVYDRPRTTVDIDLLILAESLSEVISLTALLGYTVRGLDMTFAKGAIEIRRVSKIDKETGHVLSLYLLLVTAEIRQVWDSRIKADWEGKKLSVVSRGGLIALKSMRDSLQDRADISALEGEDHA
jgi:hypothetical protein